MPDAQTIAAPASRRNRPALSERSPLFAVLDRQRRPLMAVLAFSMVINLLMLAPSLYMLQVYDRVLMSRNVTTLVMLTVLVLLLYGVMGLLEWARSQVLVRVGVRFDHAIGQRLVAASHRLAMEQQNGLGKQLMADLANVRQLLTGQAVLAALEIPWVPVYFLVVFLLHPSLGLVALVGGVALLVLTYLTERTTQAPLARANERAAEAARFVSSNLRNGEVVEAMGMLPALIARWQARQDEHLAEQALASDHAGAIGAATRICRLALQSSTLGFGAYLTINGEITPGVMIACSILAGRMLAPVEQLIGAWKQWVSAADAWGRIDRVLQVSQEETSAVTLPAPQGEVALEGVFAGPPGAPRPFLQNLNLKVPAGASVAVIGASAAGKSSLARVIAGVWRPQVGVARLDGADLRHWSRRELGPYIGYLPQDVELVEGSVAENIARHGEADSARILAAAQAAGVHEMVLRLPQGYDTQVGIGGIYLSGGQRQRIALARALYGEPPLMVLDEPNANLDEAGEAALDTALAAARARKATVFVVSHRPNAVRNCDLVIVMQAGQIALFGPRDQVLTALANAARKPGEASP